MPTEPPLSLDDYHAAPRIKPARPISLDDCQPPRRRWQKQRLAIGGAVLLVILTVVIVLSMRSRRDRDSGFASAPSGKYVPYGALVHPLDFLNNEKDYKGKTITLDLFVNLPAPSGTAVMTSGEYLDALQAGVNDGYTFYTLDQNGNRRPVWINVEHWPAVRDGDQVAVTFLCISGWYRAGNNAVSIRKK